MNRRPALIPARSAEARRVGGAILSRSVVILVAIAAALTLARADGSSASPLIGGALVLGLGVAMLVAYLLWRDASFGILLWLTATLISTAYAGSGPLELDRLAFVALVAAWLVEVAGRGGDLGRFGLTEALMAGYLVVNVASAVAAHALPALSGDIAPHYAQPLSMVQAIQTGVFFPFALFLLGRRLLTDRARVLRFLWFLTAVGLYLGLTNIFTELGPHSLVFPREILNQNVGLVTPGQGRARGIFLNGAPTGTALVLSLVAAIYLATQPEVRRRSIAAAAIPVMLVGVFFTHTRAPIFAALAVLVFCALFWRGWRRVFVLALAVLAVAVVSNLSTLESSNRAQGGLGSSLEVQDRLNIAATGLWAVGEKPLFGWGLGRYGILNTWHHRAWGQIDWRRGYGDIGHDTELAIAVELGLVGLAVWIAVLLSILVQSRQAWRALPASGFLSRRLVLAFWCATIAWFVNESFIDMRLFPYVNGVIFAWAGMVIGLADRVAVEAVAPVPPQQLVADLVRR